MGSHRLFHSVNEIQTLVERSISYGDIAGALDTIKAAVEYVINNPRSVSKVLASRDLDNLCRQVASARPMDLGGSSSVSAAGGTVILASELSRAGGHVELIKDYVRLGLFPNPVSILLSDIFERSDDAISDEIAVELNVQIDCIRAENSLARMEAIKAALAQLRPGKLILMTHHQDSSAISAALSYPTGETIFCHHADHHLCLGVTCSEFSHVDISSYSFHNCRDCLKIEQNLYWPIIVAGKKASFDTSPEFKATGGLTTCAAGRSEKFEAGTYSYDYFEIVPKVLEVTGGRHIHIGELTPKQHQALLTKLEERGLRKEQFVYIPWVSSVGAALLENKVDLYMVSFPFGGAKSVIEAMAAGIPVIVHGNYKSALVSSYFIVYQGAYVWTDETELLKQLSNITHHDLKRHSQMSRAWIDNYHSEQALRDAVAFEGDFIDRAPSYRSYYMDKLQDFFDEEMDNPPSTEGLDKENLERFFKLENNLHDLDVEYKSLHGEYIKVLNAYNRLIYEAK